jgi:sRNA-binding carbon storage regulator CsrA
MLILSRQSCKGVIVGTPATCDEQKLKITVLKIGSSTVRLRFEVGGDVRVLSLRHIAVNSFERPSEGRRTDPTSHIA